MTATAPEMGRTETLDGVTVTGTAIRFTKRCQPAEDNSAPDVAALIAAYKEQGKKLSPRKARLMIAIDRASADRAEDRRTTRLAPNDPRVKVISWSDDTGERGAKHADGDLIWESEITA